ncbi:thiopeptide-type bacteriocin biosynthesis protein [Dysgonomonas sp. GY617]|uniref:thiopeptide-type bacteriocin biosynthesis protein n=1 Tax=Dysgonomonas sp. GY617 TaxID=2780420 RepID=UPI0018836636|nr:thiopeptide-type bacteriocin biosynthesis protein [Dysgonomonas sp. GY617]MBF0574774.1 thiopeptide-type bacteriocin biosynthesis protein [Dysgonomonas sp. GY617]
MKMIQRTFVPGSKWLYIKLYTGNRTADKILIRNISRIISKLEKRSIIDKWFFIRYSDPDFHLRIRVLLKDELYFGEAVRLFYTQLNHHIKDNFIWKVQLDTYNRELERYDNLFIEDAETIFNLDSECILSILKKISITSNENYRWMIALQVIDSFLSDFALDILEKQQLMEKLSNSFKTEFGFNKYNAKQFNTKFRENKKAVESVLKNTITDENFIALQSPIKRRSKRLIPIIEELKSKKEKQQNNITINALLTSYIHMSLNRLFRSNNRFHELIIYDFMYRYYNSEIARAKNNR